MPKLTAKNGGKPLNDAQLLSAFASFPITMQRLLAFFNTNEAQVKKFGTQFDQRMGTDANAQLMGYSVNANVTALNAAWQDLLQTLGSDLAPKAITILQGLTSGIKSINATFEAHPQLGHDLEMLGATMGIVGGVVAAGGALRFASAIKTLVGSLAATETTTAIANAGTLAGRGAGSLFSVGLAIATLATTADSVWKQMQSIMGDPKKWDKNSPLWHGVPGAPDQDTLSPAGKWLRDHLGFGGPGSGPGPNLNDSLHKESYIPSGGQPTIIRIENVTNLDGRTISRVVSDHQARSMSLPPSGATGFDSRMAPSWPASTIAA